MSNFLSMINMAIFYCIYAIGVPLEKIYRQARIKYFDFIGMNTLKINDAYLIPVEYLGERYVVYLRKPPGFKRAPSFIAKNYRGPHLDNFYQNYSDIENEELKNIKKHLH